MALLFQFQCHLTEQCKNNLCFWKQRDCFKRSYWISVSFDQKIIEEQEEITKKYGKAIFPNIIVQAGTNCIDVVCTDYKSNKNDTDGCYEYLDETELSKVCNYIQIVKPKSCFDK
jgi:hypothetical protein